MKKIPNISQNVKEFFFQAISNTGVSPYKRQEKCFNFFLQCKLTYIFLLFWLVNIFIGRGSSWGGGSLGKPGLH